MQRVKADARTAGGIFLPDSAVKELNEAKVLAVGPGAMDKEGKRIPMGVMAGDKVLIPQVSLSVEVRRCVLRVSISEDEMLMLVTVRWKPDQGWRGGVLALQGS